MQRLAALESTKCWWSAAPVAAAFLEAALVDELILYVAPHFLGMDALPLAAIATGPGASACAVRFPRSAADRRRSAAVAHSEEDLTMFTGIILGCGRVASIERRAATWNWESTPHFSIPGG